MANKIPRVPVREQNPRVRATNFDEVCYGYDLNEAQLDGVEDARAAKQRNQEEDAPENAVDVADELIEEIHL